MVAVLSMVVATCSSDPATVDTLAVLSFTEHEVAFPSPAGFELAGTLSVPDGSGPFPAVALVTGSGPQDRDETLGRHRPFFDIATDLAGRGIVVLRFDDRGFGASGGSFEGATTFDFADDVRGAVDFLAADARVDGNRIGVLGHSEGGVVAPIVAEQTERVSFVVLLAGTAVTGREILIGQQDDVMRSEGASDEEREWQLSWIVPIIEAAATDQPDDALEATIRSIMAEAASEAPDGVSDLEVEAATPVMVQTFLDPWMRTFLRHDPVPALEALDIPTLAVLAELDIQVTPARNEASLRAALAGNPGAEVVVLPGLNHLFIEAETGAVSEYEQLPGPVAPSLLDLVGEWIMRQP